MIHFISEGGAVKRYVCDSADEIINFPKVTAGSTVQVITTGDVYTIDETGEWKLTSSLPSNGAGTPGKDGYTPIKGTDYFTEEDKNEIAKTVLNMVKTVPEIDTELGNFYANGVAIQIDDAGNNEVLVSYNLDVNTVKQEKIPYNYRFFGGGKGLDTYASYPATSIIMNSGKVKSLVGGSLGAGNVGSSTIIVNGGTITEGIGGGGSNNKDTKDLSGNTTGIANIFFNEGKSLTLYGGATTGLAHVGQSNIVINGGTIDWVTAGGSNGTTSVSNVLINNGTFKVVQGVNRGSICMSTITVNNGIITKGLYAGGETEDSSVNGTITRSSLNLLGGTFAKVVSGTSNGIETNTFCTGTYKEGVISEEVANNLNLSKI